MPTGAVIGQSPYIMPRSRPSDNRRNCRECSAGFLVWGIASGLWHSGPRRPVRAAEVSAISA